MNRKEIEDRLILLGLAGSQSYGTAIKGSDVEYKGVFIAPKEYYIGFSKIEQKDSGWDTEPGNGRFPQLDTNK